MRRAGLCAVLVIIGAGRRGVVGGSPGAVVEEALRMLRPHELISPEALVIPQAEGPSVSIRRGPITAQLPTLCVGDSRTMALTTVATCYRDTIERLNAMPDVSVRESTGDGMTGAASLAAPLNRHSSVGGTSPTVNVLALRKHDFQNELRASLSVHYPTLRDAFESLNAGERVPNDRMAGILADGGICAALSDGCAEFLRDLMRLYDVNGDGAVSYGEFVAAMG